MTTGAIFLESAYKRLFYYKELGDKTLTRLNEAQLHFQPDPNSNSIAVIIQHLYGNMLSRWTNFLDSDGEKNWRNRDAEFEEGPRKREQLLALWEEGWECLGAALRSLREEDLTKTIYIRSEPTLVLDAINRQLAHYPYHVGQIIYLGRFQLGDQWESLSIPKNKSAQFNQDMTEKFNPGQ